MFAAEGLAQTCYLLYADSPSGLGPDEVVFSRWSTGGGDGKKGKGKDDESKLGKWVDALREWERGAGKWRKGGIWGSHEQADHLPPGVRHVEPMVKKPADRDYWLRRPEHVLRPEVRAASILVSRFLVLTRPRVGGGKLVRPLAYDERCQMARTGMGSV